MQIFSRKLWCQKGDGREQLKSFMLSQRISTSATSKIHAYSTLQIRALTSKAGERPPIQVPKVVVCALAKSDRYRKPTTVAMIDIRWLADEKKRNILRIRNWWCAALFETTTPL